MRALFHPTEAVFMKKTIARCDVCKKAEDGIQIVA
jgi:hypothetical protein